MVLFSDDAAFISLHSSNVLFRRDCRASLRTWSLMRRLLSSFVVFFR